MSNLYIVIKDGDKYSISAGGFVKSTTDSEYIFQMLKDTHFSSICDKMSSFNVEVVHISNNCLNSDKKRMIIDYYNNNVSNSSIKPILSFNCETINEHIVNGELIITNSRLHNDVMINNYIKNVSLTFLLNDYENKLYISNPSFHINRNIYDTMIE